VAKIRHIAIFTDDADRLAKFYVESFGMTITQPLASSEASGSWVFLTDGYLDMALISPAKRGGVKKGINHFGFTLDDEEYESVVAKLKVRGIEPQSTPPDRPYVEVFVRDEQGNRIDLSRTGLRRTGT
jgi:catechol 2,3-dioxygenase-like lactoylglutathione lyase family enzyme